MTAKRTAIRTEMSVSFKVVYDDGKSYEFTDMDNAALPPEEVVFPDQLSDAATDFLAEAAAFSESEDTTP